MQTPPRKIALIFKKYDERIQSILSKVVPWIQARGVEVFLDRETAGIYGRACGTAERRELPALVEMLAVFGGDGTLLAAARLVAGHDIPILGINLGSLGFLSEVKLPDLLPNLEAILAGDYELESRILLEVEVLRGQTVREHYLALNDAVINKGALARIIEIEVLVSGQMMAGFRADGLIVSTPTGSTAYSLSAGGPILYPSLEAFIITPICPHTLTNRPVVVPDGDLIEVTLRHGTEVMLTVDGQVGMPLEPGDILRARKSTSVIRLVQPAGNIFFKVLREKLKWG